MRHRLPEQIRFMVFHELLKEKTVQALAEELSVSPSTIKRWRRGESTIPSPIVAKLTGGHPQLTKHLQAGTILSNGWGRSKGGATRWARIVREERNGAMATVRSFKKVRRAAETARCDDDGALELYGAMLGDGCLSYYFARYDGIYRKELRISGNSVKDYYYFTHVLVPILRQIFGITVTPKLRKTSQAIDIVVKNIGVFDWFVQQGFPIGEKGEIEIPERILALPPAKINKVIRGLLDTDGCISARRDEKYRYPYVFICSKSKKLLGQIKIILRGQGINAYIHADTVVVRGKENFRRWFELVGSSNPRNLERYTCWLKTGVINMGQ